MEVGKKQIAKMRASFEEGRFEINGVEAWRCRFLMELLGYKNWQNFRKAIERAWVACQKSDRDPSANFLTGAGEQSWEPGKVFTGASNNPQGGRPKEDVIVTRFGAYLIAMSADERIPAVAFAKRYFATQTRKQEILEQQLLDDDRLRAREKLAKSEADLRVEAYQRGTDDRGFETIRNRGHKAFFSKSPAKVKQDLKVPEDRDIADFADPIVVKALDLATAITTRQTRKKDLHGVAPISKENEDSHRRVRSAVVKSGIIPEQLPAAEDIKLVDERAKKQAAKRLRGDG